MAKVDGIGVASVAAGSLFIYAGIKGYSIPTAVQNIITGKSPSQQTQASPVTSPQGSLTGSGESPQPGVSSTGGSYSPSQIKQLWVSAGGSASKADVAACIAQHESGGNAGATSSNPDGGINVGLWQLDTKGKGAGYSVDQLKHPAINAMVAVRGSSNGNDWSAWSTAPDCGV